MACHRFGRTDGDFVGVLAKHLLDRARLAYVADVRGSRMGVDIVNLIRRYPGMLQRTLHCNVRWSMPGYRRIRFTISTPMRLPRTSATYARRARSSRCLASTPTKSPSVLPNR